MPKSMHKVQKHISKKKGALEAMHENSRDAKLLRRAGARDDRVARVSASMARGRQSYVDRINFFQEAIPEGATPFSDKDLVDSVTRFINRSVPEIEQEQSERRKGRPPSKREEALVQRTEVEDKEFKTGFWMPDLTQEGVVLALSKWNGNWSGLSTMKFIRLTKDGEKQASTFPPKGLS
ncbi:hypothetical protein ASPVEDRAFT_149025 [Aspergillus versicolor CBS 583.65]|uniref:Translation machinery-associated protein 16 n=1 Tax=Aspergillus versicolor CBS 583.65 TaxID=1036611 RepID=A0A1L9PF00_ASPVE|nr:uncharacterized protein ASPVEDRAFT_149025 [Aspergillus versicolor CBS 583.65]OJJ00052.1 hypothetical protein ASPVEDRAFT_149025 [Aspergillus versicolor CBS 583.65]